MKTITLLGSSSGRNAGDAALMAAIMDDLDRVSGRPLTYLIPTIRPDYVHQQYPNRTVAVGMMPWHGALRMLGIPTLRAMLKSDAILIFDAVLFDRSLFNPLFNFLSSLYLLLPIAARKGIPIVGYNVGVGPVHSRAGKHMLRQVAEIMSFITVRDQDSMDLLNEVGVRNPSVQLTADAALNAPSWDATQVKPIFDAAGLDIEEPMLGINVNRYLDTWASAGRVSMGRDAFLTTYAEALRRVGEQVKVPFVFVATQHHDVEITRALMDRLPPGFRTVLIDNRRYNHAAIKGVLRHLSLLYGMRLHSVIMASAELTPVIGLSYQPKVAYYFNELELPDYTLSFDNFTTDSLEQHILKGWEDREKLRQQLTRRIPVLREKAARSAYLVARLQEQKEGAD